MTSISSLSCGCHAGLARLLLTSARVGTRVSQGNQTHCDTIWCLKIQKMWFLAKSNVIQMLPYSNLASLHFSNKYWITLNFANIHIFRIRRPHTLLICIWFPWNISDFTLNRVKRGRCSDNAHSPQQPDVEYASGATFKPAAGPKKPEKAWSPKKPKARQA